MFPFVASGRARAMEAPAGFAKLVAAAASDEILGVHIIGPMAGELIAEAVLAHGVLVRSAEDLQRTMHAHPTLAEAVHEAALAPTSARSTTSTASRRAAAGRPWWRRSGRALGPQHAVDAAEALQQLPQLRGIPHRGAHHDRRHAIGPVGAAS